MHGTEENGIYRGLVLRAVQCGKFDCNVVDTVVDTIIYLHVSFGSRIRSRGFFFTCWMTRPLRLYLICRWFGLHFCFGSKPQPLITVMPSSNIPSLAVIRTSSKCFWSWETSHTRRWWDLQCHTSVLTAQQNQTKEKLTAL